jgi:hypothetical protein
LINEVIAATPPSIGTAQWPVLSQDGLSFYFGLGGVFVASRTSLSQPFSRPTLLSSIPAGASVSGLSSDGVTAFVTTASWSTVIYTRESPSAPFVLTRSQTVPYHLWRTLPIQNCTRLIGTSEPGGCQNENIAIAQKA